MRVEALSGTTLHLGGKFWKFGNSSGVHVSEPVNAAKLWIRQLFGEAKMKILVNTVDEQGSKATVKTVKDAYNKKVGFTPIRKDSGFVSILEDPCYSSTPKKEKEETTLQVLLRMEKDLNRLE